jgi:hypothetical protein
MLIADSNQQSTLSNQQSQGQVPRAIVAPVDATRWPGMLPDRRGPADHFEMAQ